MIQIECDKTSGKHLMVTQDIEAGTVLYKISDYMTLTQPTYQSIQVNAQEHIWEDTIIYLNHSCDPNIIVDVATMELRAIRPIRAHQEIKFFYPSTEWDMHRSFNCNCGSTQCLKTIKGAKHLSDQVLDRYFVNHYIRSMRQEALMYSNPR